MTGTTRASVSDHQQSEALLEEVSASADELRNSARAMLGVTGEGNTEKLRVLLRRNTMSTYPLLALGLLSVVDRFQGYAFSLLSPDISRTLGISIGVITALITIKGLAVLVAPMPMARLAQSGNRRAFLCLVTAMGWSLLTLFTGFATTVLGLTLILIADGLSTGSVHALHVPLLMDSYHPEARVRIVSLYTAFGRFGDVLSPLLVGALAGPLGFTWRGVFIVLAAISTLATLFAVFLKDPGYGRWDTQQLREAVHELHGDSSDLSHDDVRLGFFETCRRVMMVPTIKRLFVGCAVIGVLATPLEVFVSFFLDEKWGLEAGARGVFAAYQAAITVVVLALYGPRSERLFRRDPALVVRQIGVILGVGLGFAVLGALAPTFPLVVICFGVSAAVLGVMGPAVSVGIFSIIPAEMRPHAGGLAGIFTAIGGIGGALLLGSVYTQYGIAATMIALSIPGVIACFILSSAARFINDDLDRMIDEVLEAEEINRITRSGGRLPMLACRGIDYSYGELQVLFGVDFTVDDGEMVALLGVNGAGKSTLLKVISGIGLPTKGSVRFRGQDITYLDAERRVGIGITQIPGGKAVFGPMTVLQNLRTYGYTTSSARALDAKIDECFDAFPRLAERRGSLAAQLSGGEQQMLALSKALILQPRLLVIDELSLGLAPVVVGQLLDMVRSINARGTAVVLVEQSVNIALNLVDHAYFMEKGEMKFDGRAEDLLARDDLLRAVFLSGAAAADGGL
jgi:ABC-type branched-subunit amino acid transport system ATPase component/MFS family permease